MTEEQNKKIKGIVVVIILIITGAASTSLLLPTVESMYSYDVDVFQDYNELFTFYETISSQTKNLFYEVSGSRDGSQLVFLESSNSIDSIAKSSDGSASYSTTNVQVEGVDEPDIVKTDGSYIYVISGMDLFIVKAYPPSTSEIMSSVSFDNFSVRDMFVNDDQLIVFGAPYDMPVYAYEEKMIESSIIAPNYHTPKTKIIIYDVSDITEPEKIKTIEMDGNYFNARMIGSYVYVISIQYNYNICPLMEVNKTYAIPSITIDNEAQNIPPNDIYYIDSPETVETTTHIASIDLSDMSIDQKTFLLGSSQSLYASERNIYLASQHFAYQPFLRTSLEITDDDQMMIIHKISVDGSTITYEGKGEVPGRILNQFSMDEHEGFFRIATTTGNNWNSDQQTTNNIYVLNEDLDQIGKIEDIAPGEEIYSARFMGEKAYLVTFKKIDPFFTIDLSDPYDPQIIGKLKIPGYSDYLHPYDENHIIGIGKDTVEVLEEEEQWRTTDFAWYQGLKIALFDVTDFENPVEVSKVIIGDRGTYSNALHDHKAFLFDREKHLLVIPVNLYEIDDEIKDEQGNYTGSIYGEFTFQGAYVYDLSVEHGFQFKGRISHLSEDDREKTGFYPYYDKSITRSLFIDDFLYTISQSVIKINDLESLSEEKQITLNDR